MTDGAPNLGKLGIWAIPFRFGDPGFAHEAAAELEELGYGTIWFPGGQGGNLFETFSALLAATKRIMFATGILNIWMHEPAEVGAWWRGLSPEHRQRAMIGLGVGHASAIGDAWRKPLEKMATYLDGLDAEGVPAQYRCIAALAPRMLELSRDRTAGSHPYLVPPEHTAWARERLGPRALLAPEQGIIFDADPDSARNKARTQLETYVHRQNYRNNWMRLGFSEEDIDVKSDRFVDALFAWGTVDRIAERVRAHFDAGADHVCLQVIAGAPGANDPQELRETWRALSPAAIGLA